jgi:hypothetical protein
VELVSKRPNRASSTRIGRIDQDHAARRPDREGGVRTVPLLENLGRAQEAPRLDDCDERPDPCARVVGISHRRLELQMAAAVVPRENSHALERRDADRPRGLAGRRDDRSRGVETGDATIDLAALQELREEAGQLMIDVAESDRAHDLQMRPARDVGDPILELTMEVVGGVDGQQREPRLRFVFERPSGSGVREHPDRHRGGAREDDREDHQSDRDRHSGGASTGGRPRRYGARDANVSHTRDPAAAVYQRDGHAGQAERPATPPSIRCACTLHHPPAASLATRPCLREGCRFLRGPPRPGGPHSRRRRRLRRRRRIHLRARETDADAMGGKLCVDPTGSGWDGPRARRSLASSPGTAVCSGAGQR